MLAVASMPVAATHAEEPEYGIASTSATLSTTQAGAHPDLAVRVDLKTDPSTDAAVAGTRDVSVDLPPGLIAAPSRFPTCPLAAFLAITKYTDPVPCPFESQVGVVKLSQHAFDTNVTGSEPLYNLPPGDGAVARFGFVAGVMAKVLDFRVEPEDGYRLHAELRGLPDIFVMNGAETVVWGVPSDPSHDGQRMTPSESLECGYPCQAPGGSRPSEFPPIPLMSNPTWCGPSRAAFALTSYALPGEVFAAGADIPPIVGCDQVPFAPAATLTGTTSTADWSSGFKVGLTLPSDGFEEPDALIDSALRRLVLSLPTGYSLNPAAALGLAACSGSQVGLLASNPPRFDDRPARCPAASKLATASIETPMLGDGLQGKVYLATPREDASRSLVPLYLVAEGNGMLVKLSGRLVLDPGSGQVAARFDDLPPLPLSHLSLDFEAGHDGLLTTPMTCGSTRGEVELYGWSGAKTTQPISLDIRDRPGGAPCDSRPFSPRLIAGTTTAVAGAPSPFVLRIDRASGEQHLGRFEVRLPSGLLPDISTVTQCAVAAAAAGACPSSSQVGRATILAGAGPSPLRIPEDDAAPVYLAGPEAGAPLSLLAVVPVRAGPFDLGRALVHAPVYVDPRTAQVTVRSQPLPQVLQGVPVDYRSLRLRLDRPGFIRNPTSCARSRITSTLTAVEGGRANPGTGFRVSGCKRLRFRPRLSLALGGAPGRGGHPRLTVSLRSPAGSESISRLSVLLPASELLDMRNVNGVCSRRQFARHGCGPGSMYGHASIYSPLLAHPLRGSIRLRESDSRLPDLVASLDGEVDLELVGRVGSPHGRVRVTFGNLPDASFRRLDLALAGAQRGLLVNATDICRADPRATVLAIGQNGARKIFRAPAAACHPKVAR
ncbi:MAG TPA: hypothetical protein VNC15_07220 [Solirubrobacterales bacterium]|nr:hypothetical protein [Solirubrobacterales bacterium]